MSIQDFLLLVAKEGFVYKEKAGDKGRFVISKPGFADVEAFELQGCTQIVYDPAGRYPAQISTQYWR